MEDCREEIAALGGKRSYAIDLVGGPATLLEAVLLSCGERVFHLPGMAVNRARDGYRGEQKSDRGDARVIADQLRMRWGSLGEIRARVLAIRENLGRAPPARFERSSSRCRSSCRDAIKVFSLLYR